MRLLITAVIANFYLHPKSTIRSTVVATINYEKEKKRINMNTGVGTIVKSKVGYMRYNKREGIITSMSKFVAVCVQDVVGKNKFLVKFEYGQKIEIIASSLPYLCEKEEVGQEVDYIISNLPPKSKG